jgi:hypothetical protein
MAAPPSTAIPASWNPAVPPPPVTGAAVGIGLNEGLGDGLAEGLGLGDWPDAGEVADSDAGALVEEPVCGLSLPLALDEAPPLAAPVALELSDPLTVGESTVTGGLPLEVQAESATQASTVVRPQPATVSRTRCDVHAMAVRALIEPPHGPGNDHFPDACGRNRENVGGLNGWCG